MRACSKTATDNKNGLKEDSNIASDLAWYWLKPGRLESWGSLETAPLNLWYSRWAVFITWKSSLTMLGMPVKVPEATGPVQLS